METEAETGAEPQGGETPEQNGKLSQGDDKTKSDKTKSAEDPFPPENYLPEPVDPIRKDTRKVYQNNFQKKKRKPSLGEQTFVLVEKGLRESKEVLDTVVDFVGGHDRAGEIRSVRQRKKGKSRGLEL